MWTSSGATPFLKLMVALRENDSKVASSSKGNGGTTMRTPIWNPLFTRSFVSAPAARSVEELPDGRDHALLLDA